LLLHIDFLEDFEVAGQQEQVHLFHYFLEVDDYFGEADSLDVAAYSAWRSISLFPLGPFAQDV
jgi:hypothetical protein